MKFQDERSGANILEKRIEKILSYLELGEDNVFSYDFTNIEQDEELKLRESVASQNYQDYLDEISNHHSIPVMNREVKLYLKKIPSHGIIVDVGGCWGWHWRRMKYTRPDIFVFIVDFVRKNLIHARNILGPQINNSFLVHGDATSLIFQDNTFDGWWSVQALQHIPNFEKAVRGLEGSCPRWYICKLLVEYAIVGQICVPCHRETLSYCWPNPGNILSCTCIR